MSYREYSLKDVRRRCKRGEHQLTFPRKHPVGFVVVGRKPTICGTRDRLEWLVEDRSECRLCKKHFAVMFQILREVKGE